PLAILSASLSIMHPSLYNASHQAMQQLSEWSATNDPKMAAALRHWPTIYTNISMIANRSAPLHRDLQSHADWYDMLVSVSNYSECVLDIPSLGLQFDYWPGTVVAFSGRLLRHGVNDVSGNCCSLAFYMRDNIHNWLGVPRSDWMRVPLVSQALAGM
ncbi:hypothetical protein M404DRAFT_143323, partial [Pisolithus tinctorius Marx 270]